ncbi:MAG: SRPBCC domain-containing protein [Rhodocyclaceae bacterium]|nr:SRPBCC domain-containing protein [Rhodocyclaceae bacterium]
MEYQVIALDIYILSDSAAIWNALTNPDVTEQYWGKTRIESDWRAGSKIVYRRDGEVVDEHTILEVVPNVRLVHSFRPLFGEFKNEKESRVRIEIARGGSVCKVSLRHDDFQTESKVFQACSVGWPMILSGLKTLLETGAPLPDFLPLAPA